MLASPEYADDIDGAEFTEISQEVPEVSKEISTAKEISLHMLQQYDWDRVSINEIITYLNSGKKEVPKEYDRRQQARFLQKLANHFVVRDNTLVYGPLKMKL